MTEFFIVANSFAAPFFSDDSKSYIDDTYMKRVAADPALKAMATKAD